MNEEKIEYFLEQDRNMAAIEANTKKNTEKVKQLLEKNPKARELYNSGSTGFSLDEYKKITEDLKESIEQEKKEYFANHPEDYAMYIQKKQIQNKYTYKKDTVNNTSFKNNHKKEETEEQKKYKKIKTQKELGVLKVIIKLGLGFAGVSWLLNSCNNGIDRFTDKINAANERQSAINEEARQQQLREREQYYQQKNNGTNTSTVTVNGKEINSYEDIVEIAQEVESTVNIDGIDYSAIFQEAVFVRAIDGDTIVVNITNDNGNLEERTVRLIGVNTPESVAPENYRTENTEEGKQASDIVKKFFEDNHITTLYLQKDVSDTDRYGRDLRYVWTEIPNDATSKEEVKNKMLNAMLLSSITYNDGTPVAETAKYAPDTSYADMFEDILEDR